MNSATHTVDLVIFARFKFSRISRGGQIREFKNLAKILIIIALLIFFENSRVLSFLKSLKIRNSPKFKHAKITRCNSDMYRLSTGVPQGFILGPLLFIVYINDLCNASKLFKMIIYADDTTLYSTLDVFGN